jgi:hypothetical protein
MENNQRKPASPKRTTDLQATFVDGFAAGWYMALPESFRTELDIKLTERKKSKNSSYEWTEGPYYSFSEGQVIYDTKDAYTGWQHALQKVDLACQIVAAKPNIPIKMTDAASGKGEFRVLAGYVKFHLFRPDEERTRLVPYIGCHLSQDEFVIFLKTGKL